MREVIFRGKRLDSGKWDEGYYVYSPYSGADGKHGIAYADGPLGFVVSEADPSTIGQFTGLTDKNGKRIFEGDIVTGRFSKENVRGHIVYGSDATFFIDRGGLHGIGLNNSEDWLEVIGNIHDNHELLK